MKITNGFSIDAPIDLHLQDLTMIQLLDIKKLISHEDKAIDWNSFFAPELVLGG